MNNTINTSCPVIGSPTKVYLGESFDLNIGMKDYKYSHYSRQKIENPFQFQRIDKILQRDTSKSQHHDLTFHDAIQRNQFIDGYSRNLNINQYNSEQKGKEIFDKVQEDFRNNYLSGIKDSKDVERQNFFLVQSQSYKEICMKENLRKVEYNLDPSIKNGISCQEKCLVHETPLEIVCISDKTLICSHCALFGDHKHHSLAPLKQIEKIINQKQTEIKEIITNYKNFQLAIKDNYFFNQFSNKINFKKIQTKKSLDQSFRLLKQAINSYEAQLNEEINKFYHSLQNHFLNTIKRISLDSNKKVFGLWQRNVNNIIQQINSADLPKLNQIAIFLTNFAIPKQILSCTSSQPGIVSIEMEGKKYLKQTQEELELTINNVMKTVDALKINFNNQYQTKIKQLLTFQFESFIEKFVEQNDFKFIQNQFETLPSLISFKESYQLMNQSINSIGFNQAEISSTLNSSTQSSPIFNMSLNLQKVCSKIKKNQTKDQKLPLQSQFSKKTLKFSKRETCNDKKRMEGSVRSVDANFNIFSPKSTYIQLTDKQRIKYPCINKVIKAPTSNILGSPAATSRIVRCSSRQSANIYKPIGFNKKQNKKNQKRKAEGIEVESQDPLHVIENYQSVNTQIFDLSNGNLNDTQILYFVQKASKIRKIRDLKLSSNMLTSAGLQKLFPYLVNCELMDLSNNNLSESSIELLFKKRQKIPQLKILNKKTRQKMDEFKKLGVEVIL